MQHEQKKDAGAVLWEKRGDLSGLKSWDVSTLICRKIRNKAGELNKEEPGLTLQGREKSSGRRSRKNNCVVGKKRNAHDRANVDRKNANAKLTYMALLSERNLRERRSATGIQRQPDPVTQKRQSEEIDSKPRWGGKRN